jgi:hypothetical protein
MTIVCTCDLQESKSLDIHVDTISDEVTVVPKDQSNWHMLWSDIIMQSYDFTFCTCHVVTPHNKFLSSVFNLARGINIGINQKHLNCIKILNTHKSTMDSVHMLKPLLCTFYFFMYFIRIQFRYRVYIRIYVCMYACTYGRMYVSLYVCMYVVCIYVCIYAFACLLAWFFVCVP